MTTMQPGTVSSTTRQNGSVHSPCGCEKTPPHICCCNLVCFERPNYFCGHLLTDADLTLQQKYVIEKNKLYHRSLDGYGIACGLKLTCDCDCKGNILIHDGFAIDDCGNDLIVCETTRFDVIGALRSKGLLLDGNSQDDCEPRHGHSRCDIKQCFYITICYQETESDYETPFQSSCTAGPKQCMPTRTHESVRFDVATELPPQHSHFEELEERIRHCFKLYCDGPIGVIIKRHAAQLLQIFGQEEINQAASRESEYREDPCEIFCTLRAYFLNHLKSHPDRYNCNLYDEVCCLTCPQDRENRQEFREVFGKLLYYMQRYQYDCVFGDLIFSCPAPCEANCLVLGTVEVMNGELVRVCNTPRRYMWTPANLPEVLIYSIMTGSFDFHEQHDERRVPCCPDYHKFEPIAFLREFEVNECGRYHAAKSSIDSLKAATRALYSSHQFTDSAAISPQLFSHVSPDELPAVARRFGLTASVMERKQTELNPPTLQQALQSYALLRRNDSVVAYASGDRIHSVMPDFLSELSPDRSLGRDLERDLEHMRKQSDGFAQQISNLKNEIEHLKRKLGEPAVTKKPQRKGGVSE